MVPLQLLLLGRLGSAREYRLEEEQRVGRDDEHRDVELLVGAEHCLAPAAAVDAVDRRGTAEDEREDAAGAVARVLPLPACLLAAEGRAESL